MKYTLAIKKATLFLIFIFCLLNNYYSQDAYANHRKYWWYKSRLNNDFMKVGLGDGESMPFGQRGSGSYGFNAFPNVYNNKLNVGDAASTLGHYIAMLATEYALLSKNFQNTNKVKNELFCALNAIDRIDYKAESTSTSGLYMLNGFFIRDDIPSTLLANNYEHFNYYNYGTINNNNNLSRGFHSKIQNGADMVRSDWTRKYGGVNTDPSDHTNSNIFMSQDQVYNLLYGLAFVNKFVLTEETNNNQPFPYTGETSLVAEARGIAHRLISHLRNPKDFNGNDCNSSIYDKLVNSWKVNDPTTCNEISLQDGGDARLYAYPLAESECQITSDNYSAPDNASLFGLPFACGTTYHNAASIADYHLWNTAANAPFINPNDPHKYIDPRVFNTNLMAICNCVYGSIPDSFATQIVNQLIAFVSSIASWLGWILKIIWKLIQVILYIFTPGSHVNQTNTAITTNAYVHESPLDHGPISLALLNDKLFYYGNPDYSFEYLLNVAPCDGIYNWGINDQSHYQWSSDNRLDHPDRRGTGAGSAEWAAPTGEYNGIDYMLYHNLYYLRKATETFGTQQNIADLSDISINQPTGLTCSNVNAYETITSNNTNIGCNNPTYWRAGKTIYFGPGTSITGNGSSANGPNFHAYIQKFDCATDLGVYRMAQADSLHTGKDSLRAMDNVVTTDSYEAGAQYHKVDYPKDESAKPKPVVADKHFDNLITELPVEPIDELEAKMQEIYPNYSKEFFVKPTVTQTEVKAFFKLDDGEQAYLTVTDMKGSIIYFFNNIKSEEFVATINLTNHPEGIYLLKFTTTKGIIKTQKIIKQ